MGLFDKKKKDKKKKEEGQKELYKLPADYRFLEESVQEFLPFDDIENSMICLKDSKYRMVVEVSSINYYLKTADEQEILESQFRNAISSFDFPFAFYVQTRTIDGDLIVRNIKNDVEKYAALHPALMEYGKQYLEDMQRVHSHDSSALIKRNFLIISCDDESITLGNTKDENEKRRTAFEKLSISVQKVYEGFRPMGLRCHCLDNNELAELLFTALNKQSEFKSESISESMSEFVDSDDGLARFDDKLFLMLTGFENQVKDFINTSYDADNYTRDKAQAILEKLRRMKNNEDQQPVTSTVSGSNSSSNSGFFEL